MPPNMPAAANENEWEMAGHNASKTKIQEKNVLQNCHSGGNNQQLVGSGQVAISQGPNTRTRKRIRVKDEEEDELASATNYTKTRTSATPGVENWKAYTLCQLAKSDPESVCDLLDAYKAEFERQRIKIKSLEAEIKQEKKSHEEEVQQEKKSHEENRRILGDRIKALTHDMEKLVLQNMIDFGIKKASDDTIKGMWWQLSYKIKNTVSNYFTERPQDETISVGGIEYHIPAQPTPAGRILAVRDSLKRRQLWGHLYCNIFAPHSRCHLGYIDPYKLPSPQYLQMISKIKSALDPDLEQEADPKSHFKRVEMIQGTVAHFKNIVADKMLNEFQEDLKSIFADAWKLYTTMMTSKAIFVIEWHQSDDGINNHRYDPETMELSVGVDASDDASEHTFAVIESPALWKIGNGDGENFDSAMVICKQSVFEWDGKSEPSTSAWDESSS
ncbi:hypothetical protein CI102_8232 [Trichoderma harzianum]|nr:hypothetical protein CI102_8232 [Trichoderma harzianum]